MGRWPRQLIGTWCGTRCVICRLGLKGELAEIEYKGMVRTVPMEGIEIIKEEEK